MYWDKDTFASVVNSSSQFIEINLIIPMSANVHHNENLTPIEKCKGAYLDEPPLGKSNNHNDFPNLEFIVMVKAKSLEVHNGDKIRCYDH